uniref:Uncharacterized protein n=1 Tax=Anguilla anguilla TaxID=7936 RepID=A0A0E9QYV1_ANGAN
MSRYPNFHLQFCAYIPAADTRYMLCLFGG